jgi:HSP20 family protein
MTPFDLLREDAWPGLTPWPDDASGQPLTGVYPVDVREDDEHLYVEAELPGFQKNEIDVNLEGGVLSISAERTPEEFTGTRHLDERRYTRVQRSFALPTSVDDSDVDAKFEDGLLKLTLDKKPESRRRKITVK